MQPQQFSGIITMVILFALMYFMMIRPQKKKDKEIKEMRDNLAVGDEVVTIGGIHGKIVKVNDEIVTLEMPHAKQRIEFSKWAIGSVSKKGKGKDTKDDKDAKAAVEEAEASVEEEKK